MAYTFQVMNLAHALEISRWRYPPPYAVYNPDEQSTTVYVAHLVAPQNHYYAICDGELLVGFCCFGEDAQVPGGDYTLPNTLDIGLGMCPELTSQGRGHGFLAAILTFAQQQYDVTHFRATIAQFNQRSQKTFAQAGFQPGQTFISDFDHTTRFVVMYRAAASGTG